MGDRIIQSVEFHDPKLDGNDKPAGNGDSGIAGQIVNPDDARNASGDGTGEQTPKRKRGRPSGSRNAITKKATPLSVDGVSHILLSCHALLAGIARTPELELDANEAQLLGQGIVDVAKFYPVAVDPKMLAWINLTMIAGTIYGTRVFAIAAKKTAKEKPEGPTVVNFGIAGKPN